jgi:hypothetical protein
LIFPAPPSWTISVDRLDVLAVGTADLEADVRVAIRGELRVGDAGACGRRELEVAVPARSSASRVRGPPMPAC